MPDSPDSGAAVAVVDVDSETIRRHFEANFFERGEAGASVSIWRDGVEIVSLHHGQSDRAGLVPWTEDSLVPVWSATKGVAAAVTLQVLFEAGKALDDPVAETWPELRAARERELSFGELLSHRGGLAVIERRSEVAIDDYPAVIAALESQVPTAEGHAYHARTFGFLLDEIVRRLSGARSLGEWWRQRVADPLNIDFWIGLPESEFGRVATLRLPRSATPAAEEAAFYRAFADPQSYSRAVFLSPTGFNAVGDMNTEAGWQLGLPSMGGIGSARALGKFYAILAAGGRWKDREIFSPAVIDALRETQVSGPDETLLIETAFSAGMMKDPLADDGAGKRREIFGPSPSAFGHPGAGGSHAFADPEHGIAFAYLANQMQLGVLPNEKSLGMVRALYAAAGI